MGRMILADLKRLISGQPPQDLQRANSATAADLTRATDAAAVAAMAATRE